MGDSPNESEEEDEEEDEDEEPVKVVSNIEPSLNILEQQVPPELPLENAGFGRSEVESMDVDGVSATSIPDASSESPHIPQEGQEITPKKSGKKKVRKEVLYEEIDVSLKVI